MKKIILLAALVASFSCKNREEQTSKEEPVAKVEVKKPEKFIVEANFKLDKGDNFRLFANGVFINNTRTMNINITEQVSSSENGQTLVFDLPEGVRPDYEVGVNLGSKEIKKIEFLQIKISYGNIEFIVTPDKIGEYFYFSQNIDYNPESGTIQTKKVDGKHNPIMYFKPHIIKEINE